MIPLSNRQAEFLSYITALERSGEDIRFNKNHYITTWIMADLGMSFAMVWHMVHTLSQKRVLERVGGAGNSGVYAIKHTLEDGGAITEWPRRLHKSRKLLPENLPFYRHPYFPRKENDWGGKRKPEKRKIGYAGRDD